MAARLEPHRPHTYRVHAHWSGSTGLGYDGYERTHSASATPASVTLRLSADPAFRGDPALLNPEQLVVLAASSCQVLSFLAVASKARLDVLSYDDEAEGVMPEDDPPTRLTAITLRPTIHIKTGPTEARVRDLVEVAHRECYIANSLKTSITIEATIIFD